MKRTLTKEKEERKYAHSNWAVGTLRFAEIAFFSMLADYWVFGPKTFHFTCSIYTWDFIEKQNPN